MAVYIEDNQALITPNINTTLHTRIALDALLLNNDIYPNLKFQLKKNVLGKCNQYGYVKRINQIDNYEDNEIDCESRQGSVIFNVSYNAQICIPTTGMMIVAKLDKYNKVILSLLHGPIIIIVKSQDYNTSNFFIDNNDIHVVQKTQELITNHNFFKIVIRGHRFSPGDTSIKALGFLENVATDEEVKDYYSFVRMDDNGEV